MTEYSLIQLIYAHLKQLGLPCDVDIELRGYSETYNGRYDTENQRIFLYHLECDGTLIDLDTLLSTARHEAIHHYQWRHDPNFKRVQGTMHNAEFDRLEKLYNIKCERMRGEYYEREVLCKILDEIV